MSAHTSLGNPMDMQCTDWARDAPPSSQKCSGHRRDARAPEAFVPGKDPNDRDQTQKYSGLALFVSRNVPDGATEDVSPSC